MRRVLSVGAVLVAALGTTPVLLASPTHAAPSTAARRPATAPVVTPAAPLKSESVTVTGNLGVHGVRPVTLQRQQGTRWVAVTSTHTLQGGAYRFTTALTASRTLRVFAARTKSAPAVTSPVRAVTLARDTAALTLTGTTTRAVVNATLKPARVGRAATLQTLTNGVWTTVQTTKKETGSGLVTWSLSNLDGLVHSYRVTVGAWRGAPALTGAATSFKATPDWAVPPAVQDVAITTTDAAPVDSESDFVTGSVVIGGQTLPLQIRGTGRSSWGWDKKPYEIRLDEPTALLGMDTASDWILNANYGDPSLVRTWLAQSFSRRAGAWAPQGTYVDLTLNGVDVGSYLVTDEIEKGADRVDAPDDGVVFDVDETFDGNGGVGFRSERNTPISFIDPNLDGNETRRAAFKDAVNQFETVLYGPDFADPDTGYAHYIDVDSVVDWYLTQELFKRLDADGYADNFLTWSPESGFAYGPVWDFQLSSGFKYWNDDTFQLPTDWWVRGDSSGQAASGTAPDHPTHDTNWVARMLEDPAFQAKVAARWAELKPTVEQLIAQVPTVGADLAGTAAADRAIWGGTGPWYGMQHADTYDGEITWLHDWLTDRVAWLDTQFSTAP